MEGKDEDRRMMRGKEKSERGECIEEKCLARFEGRVREWERKGKDKGVVCLCCIVYFLNGVYEELSTCHWGFLEGVRQWIGPQPVYSIERISLCFVHLFNHGHDTNNQGGALTHI